MSQVRALTGNYLIDSKILNLLSDDNLRTICSIDDNLFILCDQIWNQRIINNFGRASLNFKDPQRSNQDWYLLLQLRIQGMMETTDAAREGYLDFLKWLKAEGDYVGNLELSEAARYGHFDVVIWLTNLNFEPNIYYVYSALINHHFGVVDYLLDRDVIKNVQLADFVRETKDVGVKKWALNRRGI